MVVDYSKAVIYSIMSHKTDKVYIGSTVQPLSKRFFEHKSDYDLYLKGKRCYVSSFEIIKLGDAYVELIKACPCENKTELRKYEGECIRTHDCVNKLVAGRTKKEYENEPENKAHKAEYNRINKVHRAELSHDQYLKNKDEIRARQKSRVICECGHEHAYGEKVKHLKTLIHEKKMKLLVE
jgi:hypothetical protein